MKPYPMPQRSARRQAPLPSRNAPILSSSGVPVRLAATAQDITEWMLAEEKLKKREAMLEQAEEIASIGSFEYDPRNGSLTCSPQLLRMLQQDPATDVLPSRRVWEIVHPEDSPRVQDEIESAVAECRPLDSEHRCILPDGSVCILRARGAPVMDAEGRVVRFVGVAQDVTERKQAEQKLHRLSQQLMQLRDEEQRRMARQLHETAAQSLAALKMTLKRVEEALPKTDDVAHALLRSARVIADETTREIRTLSYLMHPPTLDPSGLASALRWFIEGFSKRSGIAAKLSVSDDFGRLSREAEITVFRIVQEALTNVHRHSGSPSAEIRLARAAGTICVEIADRGCGMKRDFAASQDPAALGVGIAGMRERVKQLSGSMVIASSPEAGTTIRVILPAE